MKTKKKKIIDSSSSSSQSNNLESTDLYTAVVKIAVAQICKSIGYKGAEATALETLTVVTIRYLQSLATSAATSATSTGRTQCNLLDIIRSLEDLHSNTGFNKYSDLNRHLHILTDSPILYNTMRFVNSTHEIPFAKPLPRRRYYTFPPIPKCFVEESSGKLNHIPRWLPAFPEVVVDKTVVLETIEDQRIESVSEIREISKLPEKRKKVSFWIGGGGRNVIKMKSGCKGGKRISCQMYDDDDEKFVNDNCSSINHDPKVKVKQYVRKKKLQEQTRR